MIVDCKLVSGGSVSIDVSSIREVSCGLIYSCGHKETMLMKSILACGLNQQAAKGMLCPVCQERERKAE